MTDSVQAANLFKALADQHRLSILHFLATADPACCSTGDGICACDLIAQVGLAQATVSHHMKLLVEAKLVHSEKRGRWVYYRLEREGFEQAQASLQPYLDTTAHPILQEVVA